MSEREISDPRIGERIRAVRLARGFRRQKDLYERIGMNSSHYSRIEKGDRPISISDLQQIAAATSCPIEYLINGHASRVRT